MRKSYSSSPNKVLLVSVIVFIVMCIVFAFARGRFELYGLGLGVVLGGMFVLFPFVYGLGQRVELSDKEISYSSNLFELFISKYRKKLFLSEINEINLGIPRFNDHATFASINISTPNNEIALNPDLFNKTTLYDLFLELKTRNPNIKLDKFALNLIERGKDVGGFRKTVSGNFLWTISLILVIGTISLLLFKLGVISKEAVYVIIGAQLIIVPLIANRLANIFKKTKKVLP